MKRIFLMTIVALCWLMMGSCSKGSSNNGSGSNDSCSESAEAAEAAAPGFENGVTYENEFWGFSVQLPAGFAPQNNDKQMEKERGGKLYLSAGKMVDMQAFDATTSVLSPEEIVANDIEFATSSSEVLEKKVEGAKGVAKIKDDFGYRAYFYQVSPAKIKYVIACTYPLDKKQDFDNEVDKIANTLKFTK